MKANVYLMPFLLVIPFLLLYLPGNGPANVLERFQENKAAGNCPDGPNASIFSSTPSNCAHNSGVINLLITGGTAPFTYNWGPGLPATEDLSGLAEGAYKVIVTDANGCIDSLVVNLSGQVQVALMATTTPANSCTQANGRISLLVVHGTPPFMYKWSNGATTDAVNGLVPGTYTVTVTDGSQCTAIESFTVSNSSNSSISSSISKKICPGDSLKFNGKYIKIPGIYQDTLNSWLGCDSIVHLTLSLTELSNFNAEPDSFFLDNSSQKHLLDVLLNDQLSSNDFTLNIIEQAQAANTFVLNNNVLEYALKQADFTGSDLLRYAVCPGNCLVQCDTSVAVIVVTEEAGSQFYRKINNVLTPGVQDGKNDLFDPLEVLKNLGFEPDESKSSLDIYNRWGDLLLSQSGESVFWDGRSNGKPVPQGAYYYIFRTEIAGYAPLELKGAITVLRGRDE